MSLYIKGLNMPKDDEWYNIVITSNGKGFVDIINKNNELTNTEPIQTVEIPTPHGNLIDVDKYMYEGQVVVDYEKNDIILEAEE